MIQNIKCLFFLLLLFSVSSCGHVDVIHSEQLNETPASYHNRDRVSVSSAMHLAHNSYLKGCVDGVVAASDHSGQSQSKGETLSDCRDKARAFMDDILEIMEQEI